MKTQNQAHAQTHWDCHDPYTPNTHVNTHVHTQKHTHLHTHVHTAHRHSVAAAAREPIFNKMRVHVNDPMPLRERRETKGKKVI